MLRSLKHLNKASAVGARPDEPKAICAPGVCAVQLGALLSTGIDEDSQIRTAFTYPTCTPRRRLRSYSIAAWGACLVSRRGLCERPWVSRLSRRSA